MEVREDRIQERNREIGKILREARTEKDIPITTCANLIGTSRRRYVAMEEGEAIIGVAELEVLMAFLSVPTDKIWHGKDTLVVPRRVELETLPGEALQIIVYSRK
jgi:transcriptional regulator with XRE-family HTH domain